MSTIKISLVLLLCLLSSELLAVSYPSKLFLSQADRIATIGIAALGALFMLADEDGWLEYCTTKGLSIGCTAHAIINTMALKHDRSRGALFRFLLPLCTTIAAWHYGYSVVGDPDQEDDEDDTATAIAGIALGIYWFKAAFDVRLLMRGSDTAQEAQ